MFQDSPILATCLLQQVCQRGKRLALPFAVVFSGTFDSHAAWAGQPVGIEVIRPGRVPKQVAD
jgi:hypothetical protein